VTSPLCCRHHDCIVATLQLPPHHPLVCSSSHCTHTHPHVLYRPLCILKVNYTLSVSPPSFRIYGNGYHCGVVAVFSSTSTDYPLLPLPSPLLLPPTKNISCPLPNLLPPCAGLVIPRASIPFLLLHPKKEPPSMSIFSLLLGSIPRTRPPLLLLSSTTPSKLKSSQGHPLLFCPPSRCRSHLVCPLHSAGVAIVYTTPNKMRWGTRGGTSTSVVWIT
jgi:hypothetical protein